MLLHSRIQHPVGHGFFHSSVLYVNNARFNYVYDCGGGSEAKNRVHHYIRTLDDGRIDALFISHFHQDHVNALDKLLPDVDLGAVYIPYVSDTELLLLAVEALEVGEDDSTYLSFLQDPVGWFKDRGAEVVTEIRGGEPGDFSDIPPLELPPSDQGEVESTKRLRIAAYIGRSPYQDGDKGSSSRTPGRSVDRIAFHQTCYALWHYQHPVWLLIPFVQEANKDNLERFLRELRKLLCKHRARPLLRKPSRSQFWKYVLADHNFRSELRTAYRNIHSKFNGTSLCLYSGCGHLKVSFDYHGRFPKVNPSFILPFPAYRFFNHRKKYAWLGTGDALLKNANVLSDFQQHYGQLLATVHTLSLPHHGSRYNTGPGLMKAVDPRVAVSACKQSDPSHPAQSVIDEVVSQGCIPIQVTGDEKSQYEERIRIFL